MRFVFVVQAHGDIFVRGFCIEHGFDGLIGPGGVDVHPVVFLRIVWDGIVGITHSLTIFAMAALKGMKVYPRCLAPPFGRSVATTRVISNQMVLVDGLDAGGEGVPNLGFDIALNVATHEPDDIGLVLITAGEEGTIFLGFLHTQFAVLYQSAPDAHHTDIDSVLLRQMDDVIEMVPVTIASGRTCR